MGMAVAAITSNQNRQDAMSRVSGVQYSARIPRWERLQSSSWNAHLAVEMHIRIKSAGCQRHIAPCCNRILQTATNCTTLQHTASHGITLQHTTTHGNIVTTAHYFIWRHLYDNMYAAQKPKSKHKFVTLDTESNMSTLCRREEFLRIWTAAKMIWGRRHKKYWW